MVLHKQALLDDFDLSDFVIESLEDYNRKLFNKRVLMLRFKTSLCGSIATKNYYCRKDINHEHLLKKVVSPFYCGIRYCDHIPCIIDRFASVLEELNSIKRLQSLRSLWHFTIGFKSISVDDFLNNFSSIKKRQELVMTSFFRKLKQNGLSLQGIRVLDFSFVKLGDGLINVHYHFGAIPISSSKRRRSMILIKSIEKSMNLKMKLKTPFHVQSWGYKNKQAIFAYLSKRCAGLYKWDESKNFGYSSGKGKLKKDIESGVYFKLSNLITPALYIKHFYQRRHYVTFGGLPHGSIPTDNSLCECPNLCPIHGDLSRQDVRLEVLYDKPDPPPNLLIKIYPVEQFSVVKIPALH